MSNRIIGSSKKIMEVRETILRVAKHNIPVLIQGETGTGKELVARDIHRFSNRSGHPFVAINCAALTESIIESELFGHEKGAFTDAHSKKFGKFERASGGTLFLDEIGSLGYRMQSKLLRVLQEKSFERVGGNESIEADVRIISATNEPLSDKVIKGEFRNDLFHRISVSCIDVPPLRERKEDIEDLASYFVEKWRYEIRAPVVNFDRYTIDAFKDQLWPGNIRQLESCIIKILTLFTGKKREKTFSMMNVDDYTSKYIGLLNSPAVLVGSEDLDEYRNMSLRSAKKVFERKVILNALNLNNWRIGNTASYLGISRNSMTNKMSELEIKR